MIVHARRRAAWRRAALATGLLAALGAPLAAQLPAPAVSRPEPIHLGGYGSVVAGNSNGGGDSRTGVDAVAASLLLSGTVRPRLSYFGELEAASLTEENWSGRREGRNLEVERLYAEYAFADALRLRAGRFLTPIGQWNEVHAEPLTWTALRPLTTYRPFAKSTTGLMAAGALVLGGRDVGYALYAAAPGLGTPGREERRFVQAVGGRAAAELAPGLLVGASVGRLRASHPREVDDDSTGAEHFDAGDAAGDDDRDEEAHPRTLLGADFSWSIGRIELLSEAVALSSEAGQSNERGAFLQGVFRVVGPVYAVGRTEIYEDVDGRRLHIQTLGATARPTRHLTLKLGRQIVDHPSPRARDGWFVSASALF